VKCIITDISKDTDHIPSCGSRTGFPATEPRLKFVRSLQGNYGSWN